MKRVVIAAMAMVCVGAPGCKNNDPGKHPPGMKEWDEGMGFHMNIKFKEAAQAFRKSCDLKYGAGCYQLGKAYSAGMGVKKDEAKATALFTQACELKYESACKMLKKK